MKYTQTIILDSPVSKVFPWFSEHKYMQKWQADLEEYKTISGTPNNVGAITKLKFNMSDRPTIMQEEIMEVVSNKKYVASYTSNGIQNTTIAVFFDFDDKTKIEFSSEFQFSGWFKLMELLKPMFISQTKKNLKAFQEFTSKQ